MPRTILLSEVTQDHEAGPNTGDGPQLLEYPKICGLSVSSKTKSAQVSLEGFTETKPKDSQKNPERTGFGVRLPWQGMMAILCSIFCLSLHPLYVSCTLFNLFLYEQALVSQ